MKYVIKTCGLALIMVMLLITYMPDITSESQQGQMHMVYISHNINDHIMHATSMGINVWNDDNPDIAFHIVDHLHEADVSIEYRENAIGFGTHTRSYDGIFQSVNNNIYINLGSDDCDGKYVSYPYDVIKYTVAHELGHYFGYKHTDDKSSLMYSIHPSRGGYESYVDIGYNLPVMERQQIIADAFEAYPNKCDEN